MEINYSKDAIKFLTKQDKTTTRIVTAINKLPNEDIKKLQGKKEYRLRVGNFRIVFEKEGNILIVNRIDNRGQIYNRR